MITFKIEAADTGALLYQVALSDQQYVQLALGGDGSLRIFGVTDGSYIDLKQGSVIIRAEKS